jgi:hypothetical protein
MILECTRCEKVVDAEELFSYLDDDQAQPQGKWTLAKCPKCSLPLLTVQLPEVPEDETSRVFPARDRALGTGVPQTIRTAFGEARACLRAKAYMACAMMCYKCLEEICAERAVAEHSLSASLAKLKENGIIEDRLQVWAEALRGLGKGAAYGGNLTITARDARDLIEFTEALTEYLFTYRDKFDRFIDRRARRPQA